MPDSGFLAVFVVGLLGGTHCIGMCGGIVSALAMPGYITAPAPGAGAPASAGSHPGVALHIAYNLGRISSYAVAGALVGAFGGAGLLLNDVMPVQLAMYVLANLMLIALGLYLTGVSHTLAFVERIGEHLWRRIQPLTRRFLPARTVVQAFPLGLLWGWLPCGLVYSVLATALVSGSAVRGAGLMLAFGLGTLPNLIFAGLALRRMRGITRQPVLRLVAGLVVLGFGLFGLFNSTSLGGVAWRGIVGGGA